MSTSEVADGFIVVTDAVVFFPDNRLLLLLLLPMARIVSSKGVLLLLSVVVVANHNSKLRPEACSAMVSKKLDWGVVVVAVVKDSVVGSFIMDPFTVMMELTPNCAVGAHCSVEDMLLLLLRCRDMFQAALLVRLFVSATLGNEPCRQLSAVKTNL